MGRMIKVGVERGDKRGKDENAECDTGDECEERAG